MATTLKNLPVKRWTVTGISRAQPLAGTADRAREAYEAMCAAEWQRSDDAADIPAHDYVATSPVAGDAYRQTWGYDAAARTQRSATGAVCYSVKIPSDALTGEACSVVSVAAALTGDRWLDGGAIVSAILSASATPPAFSDFLAASATTEAMLAPSPADKPDGAPANWRNLRADATGALSLDVDAASDAWLHICLRVADYLYVYGAWHDGGAMLDPSTIAVTFSRDVAVDVSSAGGYPLYWLEPDFNGLATWSYDASAVFAIEVPDPLWTRWRTLTWAASAQQLRELLSGVRMPGAMNTQEITSSASAEVGFGHMVLPYGCDGWGHAAPSTVTGTIWAGYKLRTRTDDNVTGRLPVQRVAAAIYPVTGVMPQTFNTLRAPAVTIDSHLTLRLIAYRVASRPPYHTATGVYGVDVTRVVDLCKPYPIPDFLNCERLLAGQGESLAFRPPVGNNNEPSPVYQTSIPSETSPYTQVPISLLGAWTITDDIAAGTQFRFTTPLEVDGYAGLLLLAVPCDYSRGGAPASTDNVYCDWPLSGWSLE